MKNKNFLCVSTHTSPTRGFGGPSVSFRNFLDYLHSNHISYTLITTNPYKFNIYKKEGIIELFFPTLFFHRIGFSIESSLAILFFSLFKKNIVINGITTIPNFSALIGSLLNSKSNVIIFGRGSFEINRTKNWNILKKLLYKLNIRIIEYLKNRKRLLVVFQSISEKEKSLILRDCNYRIIGNIDEFTFEQMSKKTQFEANKENDLIFVGRYSPEKGIDRLLKILKILKEEKSRLKIVLIFDSLDKKQISYIRKFVIGLNCQIFINLNHEYVLNHLSKSKLIFFPSYVENYGNVLVESVIMGCIPVLYENTHWWEMYPEYCYNEEQMIKYIKSNFIFYDKVLSEKCIEYMFKNYIKNNSFKSILDFRFY